MRKGTVIRTVPPGGTSQTVGSRVRLIVSAGPEQVAIPRVVGLSRDTATARLERDGFEVEFEEEESDQPKGDVAVQRPAAGVKVDKGSTVTLVISTGIPMVEVPDVVGLPTAQASDDLIAAGFTVQVREKPVSTEDQDGLIVLQRPRPGSQRERGRRVVILTGRFEPPDASPFGQ